MEGEDESESEGVGEEDTESVEEVSVQDVVSSDDNVTSSTMELKSKVPAHGISYPLSTALIF